MNSDGFLVTARHVIQSGLNLVQTYPANKKGLSIGLAQPNTENMRGNFTLVDFDVIDEDSIHDLALLKLNSNPFKGQVRSGIVINNNEIALIVGVANLSPYRPEDGSLIGISGYPLNESVLISNGGFLASSWEYKLQEIQVPGSPDFFRTIDVADSYLADVNVNPGNSGGPAYSAIDGSAIGVCVAFVPTNIINDQGNLDAYYNSGLSIIVPSRYIIDLLNKHQLAWTKPEG